MKVSVFGLGYVGTVSAGCLAKEGHEVVGVDPNQVKVDMINSGQTPIIEDLIGDILQQAVQDGSLTASTSAEEAILSSEISFVCVGTPSQFNGSLDLSYVRRVCEEIGVVLKNKDEFHVVVIRSTILPGSMRSLVIPALEAASGKVAGVDFGVCNNPEFLREGSSVHDFYNPPKTVIGESDSKSGDILASLYENIDAPLIRTEMEVSEMVKYADNNWHAVKVAFANEIGAICKEVGIDSHKVMNIFCKDTKLNISSYYMKPGFAFGGSCLPKDVRALTYKANQLSLDLPLLNNVLRSNRRHIERGLSMIMGKGNRKVGFLGFSFKAGTDDLRESPLVEVIEQLIGKGFELKLYDRNVNAAKLLGANRDYIMNRIPHISKLMVSDMESVLDFAETIVVGNNSPEFKDLQSKIRPGQVVVDLVRFDDSSLENEHIDGICW
ncbi:nucleotide sugar dehydrogenase [Maridesulfovibrio salexigens]|uniref:UDP-glucose 6-dehydrogenase n=1 Tax=Maridesulfovibrio salexigens (strain ATCC 14822 / DSM 2638 / NCIMB 8403 / VKM B-1763) TaxID=526222 RepID=C6BSR1_MARSD|nr:nucleotide sugar dehydrogenase [Maridesulfovibrio salexigens]ACS81517.1 nucleotide sugar dehydrogenase [Maridesulfovibrio salexigens DSM 2638]